MVEFIYVTQYFLCGTRITLRTVIALKYIVFHSNSNKLHFVLTAAAVSRGTTANIQIIHTTNDSLLRIIMRYKLRVGF